jgi:predicted RNA binding protein YcfA (HicA-like mRNA interferase family)
VQHIRGLGFIGILASGSHHQMHHLAVALGEMVH